MANVARTSSSGSAPRLLRGGSSGAMQQGSPGIQNSPRQSIPAMASPGMMAMQQSKHVLNRFCIGRSCFMPAKQAHCCGHSHYTRLSSSLSPSLHNHSPYLQSVPFHPPSRYTVQPMYAAMVPFPGSQPAQAPMHAVYQPASAQLSPSQGALTLVSVQSSRSVHWCLC